jgi:hypothetical protein
MSGKQASSGIVAKNAVKKFPEKNNLELARYIYKRHPDLYNSLNSAEARIRYYRGSHGKKNKSRADEIIPRMPESDARAWEPYQLEGDTKYLLIADTHIPYHDMQSVDKIISHGKKNDCRGVLIDGDFIDCHHASDFVRDPDARSLASEIECAKEMLQYIIDTVKPDRIVYKLGNHEARLYRTIQMKAPHLWGLPGMTWNELFADMPLVEIVGSNIPVVFQDLFILHGTEYSKNMLSPVNPARGVFLRGHQCAIVAHSHVPSAHAEPAFGGRLISTWSIGCMCDLHPQFSPLNRWAHGHGILETSADGWEFSNYKIVRGSVRHA